MSARLKKPIKASSHEDAVKKARRRIASQTGTSYTFDKVRLSSKRKGTKYYHIYVK